VNGERVPLCPEKFDRNATNSLIKTTYLRIDYFFRIKLSHVQDLPSLQGQLERIRILLEDSILNNKPMTRITALYRRMKEMEHLINDRKSLLERKDSFN
jgi:hypothetical protein